MQILKSNKMRRYGIVLIVALVLAFALEILVFVGDPQVRAAGDTVSIMDQSVSTMSAYGYEISDNHYVPNSADPQLIFMDMGLETEYILISFASPVYKEMDIQVFYAAENEELSEDKSTTALNVPFGAKHFVIPVPQNAYDTLRIDINGSFYLADVAVSDEPIETVFALTNDFNLLRLIVMFVALAVTLMLFVHWLYAEKNERRLSGFELLFCLGCLVYYTLWAEAKQLNYAPDELMRYDVTQFLFTHNRLPVNDELLSIWGFSYAHIPTMFCNYAGYALMKVASVFTKNPHFLLVAARMANVLCGAGAVYFIIKISKLIFHTPARWIMVAVVAFMPQFAFLSSYVNNDTTAFLGISVIVYAWVLGIRYGWDWKKALLLAVGISVCGLSYYFSYTWVLFSVFLFFVTYFVQNKKDYKGAAKLTGIIAGVVFLLMGYTFIRHLVLYGDLLGFKMTEYYGELYAIDALKPSNHVTLQESGVSLMTMLFSKPYSWIRNSWISFVGVFGFMEFSCPEIVYEVVTSFVLLGVLGLLFMIVEKLIVKRSKPDLVQVTFWCCMILSGAVTVGISLYYSYFSDFQPQGRYCYPAMMSLAFVVAKGYERIVSFFKNDTHKYAVTSALCTGFAAVSLYVFWAVYLPS